MIPNYSELNGEKFYTLEVREIINNLCDIDQKQVFGLTDHDAEAWRQGKEERMLDFLERGGKLESLNDVNPITLGIQDDAKINITDGVTRLRVAHKLKIKKLRVLLGRG